MRPPYGSINDLVTKTIGAKYTIVLWSQDTNDWRRKCFLQLFQFA
jgi:hypothetical protein